MYIFCNCKYERITDDARRSVLSRFAGCRRAVFNKALELQNDRKAKSEKSISYLEMAHLLMEWKQPEEMAFLKEVPSQALQQTLMDLDRAIKDTFRKKGDPAKKRWPRFKAKDIGDGFQLQQVKPQDIDEPNGRVKLPKLGWLRYRRSRPPRVQMRGRNADSGEGKAGSHHEGLRQMVRHLCDRVRNPRSRDEGEGCRH